MQLMTGFVSPKVSMFLKMKSAENIEIQRETELQQLLFPEGTNIKCVVMNNNSTI